MNETQKFLAGWQWLADELYGSEPRTNWRLKKVFLCNEARDAAHDPECKVIWESHASSLRRELQRVLDDDA